MNDLIQQELKALLQECCRELEDPERELKDLEKRHQQRLDEFFRHHGIFDVKRQETMISAVSASIDQA